MSMTYNEIITAALIELGRLGEGQEASAAQGKTGLQVFNGLMAEYEQEDVGFNWFEVKLDDINETAPIGEWAREGFISLLAVRLAPRVRAPVSVELANKALLGDRVISNTAIQMQLENTDMQHLPLGAGWRYGYNYDITSDT